MDGFEKDGYWWFNCGCRFEIIGPKWGNSKIPKLRCSLDKHNINHTINFDCPATWELLSKGWTKGVFQLESPLGRQWCKKMRPENLENMAALGALLRPGCLRAKDFVLHCKDCKAKFPIREHGKEEEGDDYCPDCGSPNVKRVGTSMTEHYCLRKNQEELVERYHEAIDPILGTTYNVLAYQEQSMQIAVAVANFDLREADMLRKAIGKKLTEEMAKVKTLFMEKSKTAGIVSEDQAEEIFGWIEKSQRYSFNKCIRGDTIIRRAARNKHMLGYGYTVAHMYNIRNSIVYAKQNGQLSLYKQWKLRGNYGNGLSMCEDGRIRPNIIKDITYEGSHDVYRMTLETGCFIDVTRNHKFPTPFNGELTLGELKIGDQIIVKGDYEKSNFKDLNSFSKIKMNKLREIAKNRNHDGKTAGFVKGKENPGYTNGSYTEFKNNKPKLPQCCDKCGDTESRLECHHIDRDRSNSSLENLVMLCSSCHKKIEYKNGRTKRGEKGYPSILVRIKSIEYLCTDDVYNVEMEGPNHNFVVNDGIVTCNSHSASYGETGYICAYAKTHFPIAFYRKWLEFEKDKKELAELVNDAKITSNVKIRPPDIRYLKERVHSDGTSIFFGLQDIKDVGQAQIQKLKDVLDEYNITKAEICQMDWMVFMMYIGSKLSSKTMSGFIRAGALSCFNIDRVVMEKDYEIWSTLSPKEKEFTKYYFARKNQSPKEIREIIVNILKHKAYHTDARASILLKILDGIDKMPYKLEDTIDSLVYAEEELLGVALSCHITDSLLTAQETHSCKDIVNGYKGYAVLKVSLEDVRPWKIKNGASTGKHMAFIKCSDNTCQIDNVVAFAEVYEQYSHLLAPGSIVYITGKVSQKGSFTIERIYEYTE